ncbi:MAG: VWA domain-containing protein [bacterium]
MFRFSNQEYLFALFLIPLLILFFVWVRHSKKKALQRFGNLQLMEKLMLSNSPRRQTWKTVLLLSALFFFLVALARPQIGTRLEEVKRKGVDIFVAIDISKSMLAEDIKPNRLTKAKHEVASLVERLKGDRIGLIAFAGEAFVQCPLTLDYGALKMFLDIMEPGLIPIPGTALGKAIEKAIGSFLETERKHKVLLIITDGEDTVEDPLKMAELAEKEGIVIYTVGIGSPQGVPIPMYDNSGKHTGFKKDRQGNVVTTKLEQLTLEKIALQTNGKYYNATPAEMELGKIYDEIDKMEKKELASRIFSQYEDRFQYFLSIGLILLIIDMLLPERKNVKREWRGRFE